MRGSLGQKLRDYAEKDGRGYPDWALRYVPVLRRLGRAAGNDALILEVGVNENNISRFTRRPIIAVDRAIDHIKAAREASEVRGVVADICALPFADGGFHVVVCMDTLEHIDVHARDSAVGELLRTLAEGGTAAVTFPSGRGALRAEEAIRAEYLRNTGRQLRWLAEHEAEGLPDAAALKRVAEERKGSTHRVSVAKNANLLIWRWTWRILICGWPGRGNAFFQALIRFCTPALCRIHIGACYRTVLYVEPRE